MQRVVPSVLLALTLLSACAPALQGVTTTDPVFAPGQVWEAQWGDGSQDSLSVPALRYQQRGMFEYQTADTAGTFRRFWYDPVDSDPEFIHISVENVGSRVEKHCWVRNPGTVALNQPRQGVFAREYAASTYRYIKTGDTAGQVACTLTRTK